MIMACYIPNALKYCYGSENKHLSVSRTSMSWCLDLKTEVNTTKINWPCLSKEDNKYFANKKKQL
jgi:hypothetical protein